MDQSIKFSYNIIISIQDKNYHQVQSLELHALNEILFMCSLSTKSQSYQL